MEDEKSEIRSAHGKAEYRSAPTETRSEGDEVILTGHFSVFETFYPVYERGRYFLEKIAPGAFQETLRTSRPKVLFEHGHDNSIGRKPIGTATEVHEDQRGAFYEARLFHESSYVQDILPAIRAGEYATSFGFRVDEDGDDWDMTPARSAHNPDGLPERTIRSVSVSEFSVVLDPANPAATASVRSLTDQFADDSAESVIPDIPVEPEVRAEEKATIEDVEAEADVVVDQPEEAPSEAVAAVETSQVIETAPVEQARATVNPTKQGDSNMENKMTAEERAARVVTIQERLEEIANDYDGEALPHERQVEWDELVEERDAHEQGIQETERRRAALGNKAAQDARAVESGRQAPYVITRPDSLHDYTALRSLDPEARTRKAYDNAQRIIDRTNFSASTRSKEENQEHVTKLLNGAYVDKAALSEQLMRTSHPKYREAFSRWVKSGGTETRDMNIGTPADGGYGVPFDLDPSWILTTDGAVNPLRQIARVEKVSGTHIRLITTAGVTVARDSEAAQVVDAGQTLANPEFNAGRVSAYVPFSLEIGDAYAGLEGQLTKALAEAKAEEEAATFVTATGDGLTGVQGLNQLFVESAGSEVETGAAGVFDSGDVYALDDALAPRHRVNASFLASKPIYNAIRQLGSDTDGGDLWVRLAAGLPPELIGYSAREMSEMQSVTTSTTLPFLILGDFQKYLIVDRIGMRVEMDNMVKGVDGRPTGQRALVAFWWNGGGFIDGNAFRGLSNNDNV